MPPPPFPAPPRGQARRQPWRRRKLGPAVGGHCSPPKMLFFGNNPHYLSPLWANQTESLMRRAASCRLWEVTGRPRGGGRGGAGGGGGTFRARRGFGPARIQVYLTLGSPGPRPGGKSCLYKQGFHGRCPNISAASAWRAPLTPTHRSGVPGRPSVPSLPCPRLLPLLGHGYLWTPRLHRAQSPGLTGAGRAAPTEAGARATRPRPLRHLAGIGARPLPL